MTHILRIALLALLTTFFIVVGPYLLVNSAQRNGESESAASQTPKTNGANPPANGNPPAAPANGTPRRPRDAELARQLASPQHTMETFINAVNAGNNELAAACLDFSEAGNTYTDGRQRQRAARQLKEVIDRLIWVNYEGIPNEPGQTEDFPLSQLFVEQGRIGGPAYDAASKIIIAKSERDGLWRFSPATVAEIETLIKEWENAPLIPELADQVRENEPLEMWIRRQLPDSLRREQFILANYQWLGLLLIIATGFVVDLLTRTLLTWLTRWWLRYVRADVDEEAVRRLWKPVGLLAQALTWYGLCALADLPAHFLSILLVGLKIFGVVAAVWTAFRLIDVLGNYLDNRAKRTLTKFDDLLVALLSKTLKAMAVCFGFVAFADIFRLDWWGLLGGLGIGGIALAFAAQDTLGNFFGSITVLVDRPFEIGDAIKTDGVEGTVESVGLRSTRVRTFYDSVVTIPNISFTKSNVDNMGRRVYRRFLTTLGVQYDTTPEQIDAFCEGIRELIRRQPYTRKDLYLVNFTSFGESSLNIEMVTFFKVPGGAEEQREKHRLLVAILRLAEELKVQFAFPTRTLHLFNERQEPLVLAEELNELADPTRSGQRLGAKIAGPLLDEMLRPGQVKFTGPTPVED